MKIIKFPQKQKVSELNFRENIQIEGIPFKWSANLNDDEIKELYQLLLNERILIKPIKGATEKDKSKTLTFETPFNLDMFEIEFKDSKCYVGILGNNIFVAYRPLDEWKILEEKESKYLKKLKETDKKSQKIYNLCGELMKKGRMLVKKGEYEEAKKVFIEVIELKMNNKDNQVLNFIRPIWDLLDLYHKTNSVEEGIEFLKNYKFRFGENESISYWVEFGREFERTGDINNADRIYKIALERDPQYWNTYKRLCLMYERAKRYNDAVAICKLTIDRNLSDDTKSCFEGRLKRIFRKIDKLKNER